MTAKKGVEGYPATSPERPEKRKTLPWPLPTPLPSLPTMDAVRLLAQILERLDIIEKRLDNIEKILVKNQRTH
ncbi:MAG: hypothetical protein JSV05_03780 [Candidatus Bathyarchaeota archaeon]|nr:MAG: hypothetical protein JSV05_03780 [Candidatus Bathyarchaeota archaeon]